MLAVPVCFTESSWSFFLVFVTKKKGFETLLASFSHGCTATFSFTLTGQLLSVIADTENKGRQCKCGETTVDFLSLCKRMICLWCCFKYMHVFITPNKCVYCSLTQMGVCRMLSWSSLFYVPCRENPVFQGGLHWITWKAKFFNSASICLFEINNCRCSTPLKSKARVPFKWFCLSCKVQ